MINKKWVAPAFYFGTLISSIGSLTFNLCMIAFMLSAGFNLAQAALILGLQRLIPALIVGLYGHFTDRFSPKPMIITVEVIAALLSFLLLILWHHAETNYLLFAATCIIRAILVVFQTGSRVKITKLITDDSYTSNSKHAIWFNKATQGATLFSGLTAMIIIKYLNLESAIIFDAMSFIISGVIIYLLPIEANGNKGGLEINAHKDHWYQKFIDYFKFNPTAAKLDLLLAFSMMGTVAFQARVAGSDQTWAALFSAGYGVAVWSAGFLEKSWARKVPSSPFWVLLGIAYLLIGFYGQASWLAVGFFLLKDLAYWMVLHRISSHIQTDTPTNNIGGVTSARMTLMILILSIGEILVGSWSSFMPLWAESSIRCGVVFLVAGSLFIKNYSKEGSSERSHF